MVGSQVVGSKIIESKKVKVDPAILVLDASATLSLLLPDENTPSREVLFRLMARSNVIFVPQHWSLEISNALLSAYRRKRLDSSALTRALELAESITVTVDTETAKRAPKQIFALAKEHTLSLYDAAYLELAMRRNGCLCTLDEALQRAARKLSIPLS